MKQQVQYRINKTEYLNEDNLDQLWEKIKEYVSTNGGGGNIDLTNYVTKEDLEEAINKIPDVDLTGLVTTEELLLKLSEYSETNHNHDGVYQPVGDYLTEDDLTPYAKKTDIPNVPTKISELDNDSNYTTKTYVDDAILNASLGGEVDLSNYYKKSETYNKNEVDALITTGSDGFSPVANVEQTETGATITITDKIGTTIASVTNGDKGDKGDKGDQGVAGTNGVSPTIVENEENDSSTYKLDIADVNGTFTTPNLKGADGSGGGSGSSTSGVYSYDEVEVGTWVDGSPLYRKVFTKTDLTMGSLTTGVTLDFVPSLVTSTRVILYIGSSNSAFQIEGSFLDSYFSSASSTSALATNIKNNMIYSLYGNGVFRYYIGTDRGIDSTAVMHFILEYTKD